MGAAPTELEQRVDQALQGVDRQIASLTEQVERAVAFADDAAQAALATFRAVTAPPPDDPPTA